MCHAAFRSLPRKTAVQSAARIVPGYSMVLMPSRKCRAGGSYPMKTMENDCRMHRKAFVCRKSALYRQTPSTSWRAWGNRSMLSVFARWDGSIENAALTPDDHIDSQAYANGHTALCALEKAMAICTDALRMEKDRLAGITENANPDASASTISAVNPIELARLSKSPQIERALTDDRMGPAVRHSCVSAHDGACCVPRGDCKAGYGSVLLPLRDTLRHGGGRPDHVHASDIPCHARTDGMPGCADTGTDSRTASENALSCSNARKRSDAASINQNCYDNIGKGERT